MSPWSQAEDRDEALDRELFAGRARAGGGDPLPSLPSLADVLRRAACEEAPRRPRTERGWAQLAGGVCVAAAVLLGAVRSLPYGAVDASAARGGVVTEVGAGAASTGPNASFLTDDDTAACAADDRALVCGDSCSSVAPARELQMPDIMATEPPLACESELLCSLPP